MRRFKSAWTLWYDKVVLLGEQSVSKAGGVGSNPTDLAEEQESGVRSQGSGVRKQRSGMKRFLTPDS